MAKRSISMCVDLGTNPRAKMRTMTIKIRLMESGRIAVFHNKQEDYFHLYDDALVYAKALSMHAMNNGYDASKVYDEISAYPDFIDAQFLEAMGEDGWSN